MDDVVAKPNKPKSSAKKLPARPEGIDLIEQQVRAMGDAMRRIDEIDLKRMDDKSKIDREADEQIALQTTLALAGMEKLREYCETNLKELTFNNLVKKFRLGLAGIGYFPPPSVSANVTDQKEAIAYIKKRPGMSAKYLNVKITLNVAQLGKALEDGNKWTQRIPGIELRTTKKFTVSPYNARPHAELFSDGLKQVAWPEQTMK